MNAKKLDNVVGFDGKPVDFTVVDGKEVKLTKSGKPKKTKSNAVVGRDTWVDPIRSKEDIKKILDYIQDKIDNETRVDYRRQWARNKMYFCIGVFSGFRVSDLVGARTGTKYKYRNSQGGYSYTYPEWTGLKWSDVFCKDGKTFRKSISIKEIKTGKMKTLYLTETSKKYINEYVEIYEPDTQSDDYIFLNRQKKRLSSKTIDNFIKEVTRECDIEGNYSTHSVRKTFVYHMYMSLYENKDPLALEKTMRFTGHRNMSDLLRYLGLKNEQEEKDMKIMEGYFDVF